MSKKKGELENVFIFSGEDEDGKYVEFRTDDIIFSIHLKDKDWYLVSVSNDKNNDYGTLPKEIVKLIREEI